MTTVALLTKEERADWRRRFKEIGHRVSFKDGNTWAYVYEGDCTTPAYSSADVDYLWERVNMTDEERDAERLASIEAEKGRWSHRP